MKFSRGTKELIQKQCYLKKHLVIVVVLYSTIEIMMALALRVFYQFKIESFDFGFNDYWIDTKRTVPCSFFIAEFISSAYGALLFSVMIVVLGYLWVRSQMILKTIRHREIASLVYYELGVLPLSLMWTASSGMFNMISWQIHARFPGSYQF